MSKIYGRQGITIQGNPGHDNFSQLLMLLGSKDPAISQHLIGRGYTHNDIQSELLDLMAAKHVLCKKLTEIRQNHFFTIMADEYTDVSNKEQLYLCLRTVSNDLELQEDFLVFYEFNNIRSDTIIHVIKYILLRLNLSVRNCRGQTYNGQHDGQKVRCCYPNPITSAKSIKVRAIRAIRVNPNPNSPNSPNPNPNPNPNFSGG